jgi:Selenocysteine lyase
MAFRNLCRDIYIDNAATSRFKPPEVIKEATRQLKHGANPGRSGHCASVEAGLVLEKARSEIRKMTGDGNVVLTKNCTEALNLAIFGLCRSGEIITDVFEHNSVLRPLYKLSGDGKIKVRLVKPASNTVTLEEVTKLVTSDTRIIVISEMSNVTGARHEVEKIADFARRKGIITVLDVAQAMGHTEADYKNADVICGSGHKGLHGPQGTGFLFYRENIKIKPLLYGGTGTMGLSTIQPEEPPEGLESGTVNTPGMAGLAAGINWTLANKNKIESKITDLSEKLIDGLHDISGVKVYTDNLNGVVSFNVRDIPSTDVSSVLDKDYKIAVRSGLHCAPLAHRHLGTLQQGLVRASIGWNNGEKDILTLLKAIKNINERPI